ncbi:hypothetical protein JOC86_003892 [Bacillus pakistanensis]|uniref:DNA methylase adenine-specific domain-containing protein n=1 Tax=Rossellomorea pakistanensis TaxID=992288 RepID=A0ABS2NHI0_9BACI|nr:N-6 DNA methylase [Bacillus pakistanensis]MBM7587319.1 hypothetical protein [Bacillus pakistanensis]
MNSKLEQLYWLNNTNSESIGTDVNELILTGLENNMELNYEDIYEIQKKSTRFTNEVITPEIVTQFIKKVIADDVDVLVPWNVYGELIDAIANHVKNSTLVSKSDMLAKITNLMLRDDKHHIETGDPLRVLDEYGEDKFDLICSFPPLGYKVKTEINNQKFNDELNHLLILKSSYLLREKGQIAFVVTENFFKREKANSILPILEKQGVHLDAAFYLPPGTLTNTGIGTYLVILSHTKFNDLFISELKSENLDQVVESWKNRKESKILQNGKLVECESFTSYVKIEKELEIKRLVNKSNLNTVPFTNLEISINSLSRNENDTFEHHVNTIYLPSIGLSDVVENQQEMKIKPQNYYQIILNDNVNASYLAIWFNTELGLLVRESLMSGSVIKRINKKSLLRTSVYLPEKSIQQRILNIQSKIDEFRNELDSIENKAWNYPNSYEELNKRVEKLNREEGFSEWIDTLPFPLASILYKYYAIKDVTSKKEFLLHFFEAFAQFQVVLMLSAYSKNGSNLDEKYIYNIDASKITRATFGTWVHIGENMSKKLRQLLEDSPEQCLRLFQHKRKGFIKMISSKQIYNILRKTNGYRNDWKGHGGVESTTEAKNRLVLLENELHSLRKVIGDVNEGYQLIQPGTGHFSFGLYHCNCKLLKGTRNTFIEKNIEVLNGLDIDNLYLLEEDAYEPLVLLPFIRLMPSPNTQVNACYFYNRLDQDGVRMVSYYFDQDADVKIQDNSIQSIIDNLNIN